MTTPDPRTPEQLAADHEAGEQLVDARIAAREAAAAARPRAFPPVRWQLPALGAGQTFARPANPETD